jgi:nucleotide-binding universal stress UspA family protein
MKVLVAIDGSSSSRAVLDSAVNRSWPAQTEFCVLNIMNLERFERLPALIADAKRESESLVEEGARQIRTAGYQAFRCSGPGHPRSDISSFAKEYGADLILVGSHGHGPVGRFLLGSVAQGVLRTAPCSVEIVRPPSAFSLNRPMKVLFATDGSECSIDAACAIAAQPWPQGALFRVLSVEEIAVTGNPMDAASLSPVYPATLLERVTKEARDRACSATETAKEILGRAGLTLYNGDATSFGEPRSVILDTAKDWCADLIVVGSHGRRGLDRFLLGSVSEAVAIHAVCSVRVVRVSQVRRAPRVEADHSQYKDQQTPQCSDYI